MTAKLRQRRPALATLLALCAWTLLVHPWLGGDAVWGGSTGTTFSTSTTTSSQRAGGLRDDSILGRISDSGR